LFESGYVAVQKNRFSGGRTAVVLAVSGDFSWVISDNKYEKYVDICLTFPMITYALDSELYFKRYRCLNPGMLLPKKQITDCRVHLVDCFGLIRC
jgi:lipoate-protein ligase A